MKIEIPVSPDVGRAPCNHRNPRWKVSSHCLVQGIGHSRLPGSSFDLYDFVVRGSLDFA